MKRSVLDYVFVLLIGVLLAIVTSVGGYFAKLGLGENLILILVSEVLLIEITNYIGMQRASARKLKVITNESQLVNIYNDLKKEAATECFGTFTTPYKVTNFDDYFKKERKLLSDRASRGKPLTIRRMINITQIGWNQDKFEKHVSDYASLIVAGSYACRETHMAGLEIAFADYSQKGNLYGRALLILNEHDKKICFLFDEKHSSLQAAVVYAVKKLFEGEWDVAEKPATHR